MKNLINLVSKGRLRYRISNIPLFLRSCVERITQGQAKLDVWSFDTTLAERIVDMAAYLADNSYGHPSTPDFDSPEKWKNYLQNLAELWTPLTTLDIPTLTNDLEEFEREKMKQLHNAIVALEKGFFDLWD